MSTSDAAEPELSVVGGHTATPLCGAARLTRTATVREQIQKLQEFGSFRRENHRGDTAPAERRLSAKGPDDTRKARILSSDGLRKDEAPRCAHSDVHTQSSAGPSFTSCLLLRLSKPELRLKRNLEPLSSQRYSLTEPLQVWTQDSTSQVNGRASSPGTCSVTSLSETHLFPPPREEEVVTVVNHEQEITKDSPVLSNCDLGPRELEALHLPPCGSQQRSFTGSLTGTEKNKHIKDNPKLESDPSADMLSSSVATVLAPHWSGRLRRSKRFDGTSYPETQGNLQDVANANRDRAFQPAQNQHRGVSVLPGGSRYPRTVSSLSTRRNTVGWSAKSDPSSLDFESKRDLTQTVSLDAGAISPSATTPSSGSLLLRDRNEERRNPHTGHQGALSSNPATSGLLLSYRKFDSNGRNSDSTSISSSNGQNGKPCTTQLSQTLLNNNGQERQKPLLSPSSLSYRTTEPGPVLSPTYSNHRERNMSDTLFFSTSITNRDAENNLLTQQPQAMNRVQTSLRSSKQTFQSKGPPDRQQNHGGSEKPISETFTSLPRHSPYDHSNLLKAHSLPRRTTLTSTSWWKQVSPEVSSPDTTNIKNEPKTAVVPPFNRNSDMAPNSLSANKRPVSQIPGNRDHNNTTEPVWKGNMNLALNTQSPESERLYKQHYGSNLNNREPQKPHIMPDGLSRSNISRATTQITLTHTRDPSKRSVNNTAFTARVTEFSPNSLNPRSPNPPRDSSSKLKSIDCVPRTSTTPAPHNMDSQKFTKSSLSLDFTPTLSSQTPTSQTASSQPPALNTFPFHSHPVSSETSAHASSSLTPKFTNKANVTPLGFERSYPSISKPFHPKTVPSTVNSFSKARCSPVSTSSTTSSSTAAPSLSLLCVPATPASTSPTSFTASSLLTPPATPVITSPNSETSSPKGGSIFSNSPDRELRKPQGLEGKKGRRVTWGDSVDVHYAEPVSVEKPDPPEVRTNPVSPSKRPQSFPSIFSFLRSGSPGIGPSPIGPPDPKNASIQVGKGGKYRSLSSDSADLAAREREKNKQRAGDSVIFDQGRADPRTPRQERTLSVESGMVQYRSSAPLSLPPDFSSRYKLRYSSPPYSALMSNRQTQGESNTTPHRLPLFSQPSQSNYTPQLSTNKDSSAATTLSTTTPSLSPVRPAFSLSLPFQKTPATQRSPERGLSDTNDPNNNDQDRPVSHIELLDNRVLIRTQSLPGDKEHSFSSTYVTETLVYSIKPKVDEASAAQRGTTPRTLQHNANTPVSLETKLSQQPHAVRRGEAGSQSCSPSDQSSNGSGSRESQSRDYESSNRSMKESKSRFYSVEVSNEQSPKRSRFALKKSDSAPNSVLSRTDSDRVSKSYNKMDQVFNKLRQKFSSRRSDDDLTFPWKWRRASQTPSLSGCSDVSSVSDNSADSTKTLEDRVQDTGMALSDNTVETDWTRNRYPLTPPPAVGDTTAGYQLSVWSEKPAKEVVQDEQKGADNMADSKVHLSVHNPAKGQFESYENSDTDFKATNQFFACRDPNASPIGNCPAQCRKSTPSPRSPFSPFSSLAPVSPFPSPDATDDSVFYSPKLQRRRESSSPCEPREGFSLRSSRSRASIGPPSASPGQDKEHLASSYADLKYGIEPGRSFSVSSVLSSRPSGPGRISTGSRFMSVGDLSQSALSCGSNGRDWDQGSVTPDWTREFGYQATNDRRRSYLAADPSTMRSRSLPRSLTRCLANWSSGVPPSQPVAATASKPARLRSPNMNTCHFAWDTQGPPTPPPTPPLSPVSRRMSKPPSLSSPTFPGSSGAPQQVDAQSSRRRLPSRDYVSSLSAFDESSDSSSDTTTDDEYYLEADEDGEKETEL